MTHALIWSEDFGATWKQSSWYWSKGKGKFKPTTFLEFGKDYTGAPDDYIYFYGRNQKAWGQSKHGYLGRVHQKKIKAKDAYQFFAGLDKRNKPIWSSDIASRKSHFTDPAGVEGIQVIFHTASQRYLLTMHRGEQGTFGIFDAQEPWGPWTTVAYYDNWLELHGTGAMRDMLYINIPTKWISSDGGTLWAIFSGGLDRLNLIQATLHWK